MISNGRLFALWDLNTGKSIHHWSKPDDSLFKPKAGVGTGGFLHWGSSGRVLEWSSPIQPPGFTTWSISPPKRLASGVLSGEQSDARAVQIFAFSPNGKRVAVIFPAPPNETRTGRAYDELRVWDAEMGKEVFRSRAFPVAASGNDGALSITWSPDSSRIVVAGGPTPGSKLKVFDATAAPAGGKSP
jgi:WD40 repeat protein